MQNNYKVKIGNTTIGDGNQIPFVLKSVSIILSTIKLDDRLAIEGRADFLKFQTYDYKNRYFKSNLKYKEFTNLVKPWQFSKNKEKELWKYAKKKGKVFTSVYDLKTITFTEELGTIAYKVTAFD